MRYVSILSITMILLTCAPPAVADKDKPEACATFPRLLDDLSLVMKEKNNYREVYVNKFWDKMPLDTKEKFTTLVALCLTQYHSTDIYDGYSGKHLATYGPLLKFRVKE